MEFAYVTDGACTEDEILDQELIMLKVFSDWESFINQQAINSL